MIARWKVVRKAYLDNGFSEEVGVRQFPQRNSCRKIYNETRGPGWKRFVISNDEKIAKLKEAISIMKNVYDPIIGKIWISDSLSILRKR